MSNPLNSTIKDAIHAWIVSATGLAPEKVYWDRQNAPRATGRHVSMRLSVRNVGRDWTRITDTAGAPPGNEITHHVEGPRMGSLGLTAYEGDPTDETGAAGTLATLPGSLGLPSVHAALVAAGIGVGKFSQVIALEGVIGSAVVEPQATCTVPLHLTAAVSETGTYIETVKISTCYTLPDGTVINGGPAFSNAFGIGFDAMTAIPVPPYSPLAFSSAFSGAFE